MGQILRGGATTSEPVHRAIQHRQERLRTPAEYYGINQKTAAEWKRCGSVADLPTGPKDPKASILPIKTEAAVVTFRRHMMLLFGDVRGPFAKPLRHLVMIVHAAGRDIGFAASDRGLLDGCRWRRLVLLDVDDKSSLRLGHAVAIASNSGSRASHAGCSFGPAGWRFSRTVKAMKPAATATATEAIQTASYCW